MISVGSSSSGSLNDNEKVEYVCILCLCGRHGTDIEWFNKIFEDVVDKKMMTRLCL